MSLKRVATFTLAAAVAVTGLGLTGCGAGSSDEQVIIYSNADEEAITAMENALDSNGYEGKYMFQTFGTSELGGRLLAEGADIEADMVTMSTFYSESAQEQNSMFQDLSLIHISQDTHAGGSGCGCAAVTLASYILPKIEKGEWKRVLFVPTGALMSTVSYNEGASVPGIAHGIVLEHC